MRKGFSSIIARISAPTSVGPVELDKNPIYNQSGEKIKQRIIAVNREDFNSDPYMFDVQMHLATHELQLMRMEEENLMREIDLMRDHRDYNAGYGSRLIDIESQRRNHRSFFEKLFEPPQIFHEDLIAGSSYSRFFAGEINDFPHKVQSAPDSRLLLDELRSMEIMKETMRGGFYDNYGRW